MPDEAVSYGSVVPGSGEIRAEAPSHEDDEQPRRGFGRRVIFAMALTAVAVCWRYAQDTHGLTQLKTHLKRARTSSACAYPRATIHT